MNYEMQLEIAKNEANIRFGSLHERRIEIIEDLYHKFYALHVNVNHIHKLIKEKNEDENEVEGDRIEIEKLEFQMVTFIETYRENRIYFSKEFCKSIDEFLQSKIFYLLVADTEILESLETKGLSFVKMVAEIGPKIKENSNYLNEITEKIENEFRKMIGVI